MIDPHIFAFPLSLILATVLVLCIILLRLTRIAGVARGRALSALLLLLAAVLVSLEGTWAFGIYHHWSFIVLTVVILFPLGLMVFADLKRSSLCGVLSHLGLFLVLAGGLFGSADGTSAMMRLYADKPEHMAIDTDGNVVSLPFEVQLQDFIIDRYEDGTSPKQFTSTILVDGKPMQTSVNHPCRHRGYRIYQSGYDMDFGEYSLLRIVRDPWLGVLAIGAILLTAGALLSLRKVWSSWKLFVLVILLAAIFTVASVARINFGTLMPALRSLWFIPHLIVYMLAYALLALSLVAAVASMFTAKVPAVFAGKLLSTASSLLLLGIICGAVWAQQVWGSYWTWDTKECWAAATWLFTIAATHVPGQRKKLVILLTAVAFIAMNVTWYGVNYLPSSSQSLHTYNIK